MQLPLAALLTFFLSLNLAAGLVLTKRIQININGELVSNQDVSDYIDQIAELSRYIVDNVRPNHALFLRFFGTDTYYNEVMAVFRRLANIRNVRPDLTFTIDLHNVQGPAATDNRGQQRPAIAQYVGIGGTGQPALNVYQDFQGLPDLLEMMPATAFPGQLDHFEATRQGVLFHELVHWAGDSNLFGPVVDPARADDPNDSAARLPNNIVDVAFGHAVGAVPDDMPFLVQHNIPFQAVVYGEDNVLVLPQLGARDLTTVNADTYTLFALAVYFNWNGIAANPPDNARLPDKWNDRDDEDPFKKTNHPFQNMAANALGFILWAITNRKHDELR